MGGKNHNQSSDCFMSRVGKGQSWPHILAADPDQVFVKPWMQFIHTLSKLHHPQQVDQRAKANQKDKGLCHVLCLSALAYTPCHSTSSIPDISRLPPHLAVLIFLSRYHLIPKYFQSPFTYNTLSLAPTCCFTSLSTKTSCCLGFRL